ncbi:hypothetical protein POTOM_017067 [Populus tomentosa]|uniref:DNA-binding protein RHL1 n=1 Tax=Populus tomentosa TaxID=118781 RepID=A0A8X8AA34_POPTO|nr:hypothetical protein POTOM_017067 [Populus tomentosa]
MVKSKNTVASNSNRENPDVLEKTRLKKLATTNNIVSDAQVKAPYSLNPSKIVAKHHGKDIIRKSQRKNRFLFSFPGLLAPINGGGRIGELKDLSSKNPVLYLDFPQGQMKLFGTILHPKNRYLTLQFSRSGKNVMCEDYFDHMIIFSEAWWIGTKEENPEELKLDFPNELFEGKGVECDFKGGAGAGSVNKQVVQKSGGTKYVKEESPETELDDDLSDDNNDFKDLKETTPIRQSARTSGKKFKFTEVSSGDDSAERSPDALGVEEEEEEEEEEEKKVKTNTSSGIILEIESESSREGNHLSEQIQASITKSKKLSESAASVTIPKENSYNSHGSLVQSTISTLFKKVQEKKKVVEKVYIKQQQQFYHFWVCRLMGRAYMEHMYAIYAWRHQEIQGNPHHQKVSTFPVFFSWYAILKVEDSEDMYFWYSTVSDQKLQKTDWKRKIDLVEAPRKRGTVTEGKKAGYSLALILQQIDLTIDSDVIIGTGSKAKKKVNEVEDDDIEEFSSSSQKFDVSITAILLIEAKLSILSLDTCWVLKEVMKIGKPEIVLDLSGWKYQRKP